MFVYGSQMKARRHNPGAQTDGPFERRCALLFQRGGPPFSYALADISRNLY